MQPTDPALRILIRRIWTADPDRGAPSAAPPPGREHVLPTGDLHLVFRLSGPPLKLFDGPLDRHGRRLGFAIVGGARSAFYVKDVTLPSRSIGVQFKPGAAQALFGLPAGELSERHTSLAAQWGEALAESALARLHEAATPAAQRALLEDLLLDRWAAHGSALPHPISAWALRGLRLGFPIERLVEQSGFSHRHFIALFRAGVGLAPNRYRQVLRLSRALDALHGEPDVGLADLALRCGFSDQSHFQREFLGFAGMTPQAYRRAGATAARHVPV